jgi:Mg-chelatase subunit ChlD
MMNEIILNSSEFSLKPQSADYLRERLVMSSYDAERLDLKPDGEFCTLTVEALFPGPAPDLFPVRVSVDPEIEPGALLINTHYLDEVGIRVGEERLWSLMRAPRVERVRQATVELVTEQEDLRNEIEYLERRKSDLFWDRCMFVTPEMSLTDISLPVLGRGYFNFRDLEPTPASLQRPTILVLGQRTDLQLFVPHRKGGVDMVILIDASGSMDLKDYVGSDGRPHERLEGVRQALETLIQRRLVAGSRVSTIALVLFGTNTTMLYPAVEEMTELDSEKKVSDMQKGTHRLNAFGLNRLGVDRNTTDIPKAMQFAAELLDYYSHEKNERMIILLSDGADWHERDEDAVGEVVTTLDDPAILADNLYFDSRTRIHTIAISDIRALRKYEPRYRNTEWAIPNTQLLEKVSENAHGLFFERPDAKLLGQLFEEIGEGMFYPLSS